MYLFPITVLFRTPQPLKSYRVFHSLEFVDCTLIVQFFMFSFLHISRKFADGHRDLKKFKFDPFGRSKSGTLFFQLKHRVSDCLLSFSDVTNYWSSMTWSIETLEGITMWKLFWVFLFISVNYLENFHREMLFLFGLVMELFIQKSRINTCFS